MVDAASTASGRERGGRARRQRAGLRAHAVIAGVERKIPTYELLGEEGLARIEIAADTILLEVGIEFRGDEAALRLWREAGADVQGERVRFPVGLLRSILKTAPNAFVQHARNPERSLAIGRGQVIFAPAYGSPFVRDPEGGRRYGTLADFENFVKLAYAIPWLHHSGGTVCEPVDVPVSKRHLDMVAAHLTLTDKPFMGSVTAEARAEDSIEMARIAFGREFVERNCVIMGNINANSPLVYDATMTKSLRAYARANQCAVVVPFILGGAMGPVTNAGAIAQSLAETMAGCALAQLERPGARSCSAISCLRPAFARDRRPSARRSRPWARSSSGSWRAGSTCRCAARARSRRRRFPTARRCRKARCRCPPRCCAARISSCIRPAGLTMGYEKFVMDADFCAALHVWMGGMALDDNALALDAFREVGAGKHFFGSAHTLANYETAYWESAVADNNSFEQWRDEGMKDAAQRAAARVKTLLAEYEGPKLDPAVEEELADFVRRRKAELPDEWY
jgi:trimethylamine---corrinoid protein Co-methyltransferase